MDKFKEIKDKYSVVVPIENINNIDIVAVDFNDLRYLINKVEQQQEKIEEKERILKLLSMPDKKIIVQTPPLPESEVIRMLQDHILNLRQELNRYHTRTFI